MSDRDRGEALLRVQRRLTDRDLTLLGWLADHSLLTTPQIAHALFPSLDFAQRRLLKLTRAGVIGRFQPHRPTGGTYPNHYLLTQLGVDVVAAQRGEPEMPRRDEARQRRWWLTNRANLPHLLAVNQFFIDLAGHARTHPDTALEQWWPASRLRRPGGFADLNGPTDPNLWNVTIAADGHAVWTHTRTTTAAGAQGGVGTVSVVARVPFFVEVDLGTEDLPRLVGKLDAYRRWRDKTGRVWPVLFWLTSPIRERHLHDRLPATGTGVPVATAVNNPSHHHDRVTDAQDIDPALGRTVRDTGPAGPVWWLHHNNYWLPHHPASATAGLQRVTLLDLAPAITDPRGVFPTARGQDAQPPGAGDDIWRSPQTTDRALTDVGHNGWSDAFTVEGDGDGWADDSGWHDNSLSS